MRVLQIIVERFLADRALPVPGAKTSLTDVYRAFRYWKESIGLKGFSHTKESVTEALGDKVVITSEHPTGILMGYEVFTTQDDLEEAKKSSQTTSRSETPASAQPSDPTAERVLSGSAVKALLEKRDALESQRVSVERLAVLTQKEIHDVSALEALVKVIEESSADWEDTLSEWPLASYLVRRKALLTWLVQTTQSVQSGLEFRQERLQAEEERLLASS